ncbi:hypothetical protein [Microbacterium sp. NPDC055455]
MTRSTAVAKQANDPGFGLVEVVVGMLLLMLILIGLLPALIQGVGEAARQSSVATATRLANARVEAVRESPSCLAVLAALTSHSVADGQGNTLTASGTLKLTEGLVGPSGTLPAGSTISSCSVPPLPAPLTKTLISVEVEVRDQANVVVAEATALVYLS